MITTVASQQSDITVKNIYRSFTHKMAAKASWHQNYVTVTLYTFNGTQTQTDRPMQCPSPNIFVVQSLIFTARSCASAVYALALCVSVRLSVRHKSVFY